MIIGLTKKHWKIILLVILLLVVVGYFVISFFIADTLTKPTIIPVPIEKEAIAPNGEDIEFYAPDEVRLAGWFFRGSSDKVVIMVHGVGETRANVYYGGAPIAQYLLENGYGVLMYDMRGNGESDPTRFTLGLTEGRDVLGAIEFLNSQGYSNDNIAVLADSLGAISTLMQIRKIEIGAIVVDSPAAVLEPIITREMTVSRGVPKIFIPGTYLMAKIFFNIDVDKVRPIDEVTTNDTLLLFHGGGDTFIDPSNSHQILKKAASDSELQIFDGSDHVKSFFDHNDLFKARLINFLNKQLN